MLEIKDREEDRARAEDRADDRPNAEVILPRQIRVQVTSVNTFKEGLPAVQVPDRDIVPS